MKNRNRILPLALAGAMAFGCLTGCGGASSDSTGGNAESGTEQGATSEVASTEAEPVQATYPLADGDKTITVYMRDATSGAAGDWNNIKGFQKAEEILGVDIEFIMPAVGSEADQFNLMIASGEYPDIIMWDFNSTPHDAGPDGGFGHFAGYGFLYSPVRPQLPGPAGNQRGIQAGGHR